MAGDGVSLPTTISQLGNVARTQLKGQQVNQQATPLSEQLDQSKDLKVNRVKQLEKADKGRVESDEEKERRRRHGQEEAASGGGAVKESGEADAVEEETAEANASAAEGIGRLVDTRA